MRKQRSPWTKKQQFIFGIIVIVVTLIASLTAILIVATKPYVDAEKKVIAIAESKADIKTVTEFDIYHGEATYYGLLGKSGQGEKLAVIVSHDSGEVDIYKQSDGISKSVAKKAAKAYGALSLLRKPRFNLLIEWILRIVKRQTCNNLNYPILLGKVNTFPERPHTEKEIGLTSIKTFFDIKSCPIFLLS